MNNSLEEQVQKLLAHMEGEQQEPEREPSGDEATDGIQDIYVLVVREREEEAEHTQVVDSAPPKQVRKRFEYLTLCLVLICSLPMLGSIAFQVDEILNPPIATVTIVPKSQTVTLTGILQLGRVLPPLTISQSQTVPTTGKGYQDAKAATGFITFYNGQLNSVTVPAGTILTASNGVQVITEQDALIPAASPPTEGQAAITAHAVTSGTQGNISAKDINEACCALSVLAVNLTSFTGGQDERDFQTVARSDIDTTATPLKTAVAQSMQGAFQGKLKPNEQLQILPCTPTVTSDHQPGQEATQINVTVSETCSAVAYNEVALQAQATALLAIQATQQAGAGYTLVGEIYLTILQVIVAHRTPSLVFSCWGTWVYGVTNAQQQFIKSLIAGKTKQQALDALARLPGIQRARIGDVDDNAKLPRNPALIHLVILV